MQNKKKKMQNVEKVVASIAVKIAEYEANTACACILYQSKESNEVKALRKF